MCGIIGYAGKNNLKKIVIDGLKELEYRGYDSAGMALFYEGEIKTFKAVGNLKI